MGEREPERGRETEPERERERGGEEPEREKVSDIDCHTDGHNARSLEPTEQLSQIWT